MGSGTPVLRDFAKIVNFGHTGFISRMGPSLPYGSHFRDRFGRSEYSARAGVGLGWWMDLGRVPARCESTPDGMMGHIWDYRGDQIRALLHGPRHTGFARFRKNRHFRAHWFYEEDGTSPTLWIAFSGRFWSQHVPRPGGYGIGLVDGSGEGSERVRVGT